MKINKKDILYILKLALILLAISFVCTILLTVVNALTKTKIAERSQKMLANTKIYGKFLVRHGGKRTVFGFDQPCDRFGAQRISRFGKHGGLAFAALGQNRYIFFLFQSVQGGMHRLLGKP